MFGILLFITVPTPLQSEFAIGVIVMSLCDSYWNGKTQITLRNRIDWNIIVMSAQIKGLELKLTVNLDYRIIIFI